MSYRLRKNAGMSSSSLVGLRGSWGSGCAGGEVCCAWGWFWACADVVTGRFSDGRGVWGGALVGGAVRLICSVVEKGRVGVGCVGRAPCP